jgi:hypothetical protein
MTNSIAEQAGLPLTGQRSSERFCGPLFVIGVWRSGTSLLYALLNRHPDIRLFYEGDLAVLRPMFQFPFTRKNWLGKWQYWNAGVARHGLDSFQPPEAVSSFAEAYEAAGCAYSRQKGARIWGCKSPSYYDRPVRLSRDFPRARFVVIWRDPEDICVSIKNAARHSRWFAGSGMMLRAILACETLRKQCDALAARGVPVHHIHYEDLVKNTADTMRGICQFLDVPFDPAVTSLEGADRSAIFEGGHHTMVKGAEIVSSRKQKEGLPAEVGAKVRRYKALWKSTDGGDWLLCKHLSHTAGPTLGVWERLKDKAAFSFLRLSDDVPRVAYSLLPLWLWKWYRAIKYQNRLYHDKPLP